MSAHSFVVKYGQYLHGNPLRDRKVVLSREVIQSRKLTRVDVVEPSDIVGRFIQEARTATEDAKQDAGNVLLLVFCHNIDGDTLALDYTGNTKLSISALHETLDPATSSERFPGSIFARSVIKALTTVDCELFRDKSMPESSSSSTRTSVDGSETSSTTDQAMEIDGESSSPIRRSAKARGKRSTKSPTQLSGLGPPKVRPTKRPAPKDDADKKNKADGDVAMQDAASGPVKTRKIATAFPKRISRRGFKTAEQHAACQAFLSSVWDVCRGKHHQWCDHEFDFSPSSYTNEWKMPWASPDGNVQHLSYYQARWNMLQTHAYRPETATTFSGPDMLAGQFTSQVDLNRVRMMVSLWRITCPGDHLYDDGPRMEAFMTMCARSGRPTISREQIRDGSPEDEFTSIYKYNFVAVLQHRYQMAMLAEDLVEAMELPRPGGKTCLHWYEPDWKEWMLQEYGVFVDELERIKSAIFGVFDQEGCSLASLITPAAEQGPVFHRFIRYMAAAIIEGLYRDSVEGDAFVTQRIWTKGMAVLEFFKVSKSYLEEKALADPKVRDLANAWAESMQPESFVNYLSGMFSYLWG
ncbi:hypothetical protein SBRCBS47491_001112 [Sporothrix bragantina]|uniref:Uncharacterized protein n=1 Tax=Sporothrix bragantina TaxID=671064 RepID=A0ABP0AVW0_9PEZI